MDLQSLQSLYDKIMNKVELEINDECLIFGGTKKNGYGVMRKKINEISIFKQTSENSSPEEINTNIIRKIPHRVLV